MGRRCPDRRWLPLVEHTRERRSFHYAGSRRAGPESPAERRDKTYQALQDADLELGESLAGLVTVSDILESLGCVLATNVKEHLLAATVFSIPSASAPKGKRVHRKSTRSDACACARKPDAGKYDFKGGVGFYSGGLLCLRQSADCRGRGGRKKLRGETHGCSSTNLVVS